MTSLLKIGVLDYSTIVNGGTSFTTIKELKYLKEAILKNGAKPVFYDVKRLQIVFGDGGKRRLKYDYKNFSLPDFLIPKVAIVSSLDTEITFLKQFELEKVKVMNGYLSIKRAKNKLRTAQLLSKNGIPIPDTIVVRKLEYIDNAISKVGGYPVILKTPFGTYGSGVVIVESKRSLLSALSTVWNDDILLIQRYVAEANGKDYRVFVLGNDIVGAMERSAREGEFRSNLHLGGTASVVDLTEEEKRVAVESAKALGLQMAGVDLLRSNDGPVVMEVNGNPGFYGLMSVTGIDIADAIVKYAIRQIV